MGVERNVRLCLHIFIRISKMKQELFEIRNCKFEKIVNCNVKGLR